MHIFNSHVHTNNSKDSNVSMDEMCLAACTKNLSGLAITDHCEISSFISENSYQKTKASVMLAAKLKEKYAGKLHVGVGTEIGDGILNPEYTSRILRLADFDVVLASVHVVKYQDKIMHLSRVDFSKLPQEVVSEYMKEYFDALLETAEKSDFDVLSHLTIPLRYTNAECGMNVNIMDYAPMIDRILKAIIKRDKSIEVNTSEINRIGLMPDKNILVRYRELGGKKVTIGSDAHNTSNLTLGIDEAIETLKACGFTQYGYYEKRRYIGVNID